ncbi:MAG: 6-bladed beta-propeller [bacterium]|nr:6-bladed beta-propeller [bacterium]
MKRSICVIALLLSIGIGPAAAKITENAASPSPGYKSKSPGRIVGTTEILRITDNRGTFLFQAPGAIKIAPDESIFVKDKNHLLKFKSDGTFVTKMVTRGEGPGEVKWLMNYQPGMDEITVGGSMPAKILRLKADGSCKSEFRLHAAAAFTAFLARYEETFYHTYSKNDHSPSTTGVKVAEVQFSRSNNKGVIQVLDFKVPVKYVVLRTENNGRVHVSSRSISYLQTAAVGRNLFVCSQERYLVHLFDLEKGKEVCRFRRKYKPVKYFPGPDEKKDELSSLYKREYFNDINLLMTDEERVWVVTSVVDKSKGLLVDVFNDAGMYIDNFHMQIPGLKDLHDERIKSLVHYKGYIYLKEVDEDGAPSIVKYKLDIE